MLRIGLTGGIGSGKSTVADLFRALGVPVIDADVIAHRLTRPGEPATREIVTAFGPEVAAGDGLDRKRLAQRIYSNPADRRRLEAILHPLIRSTMLDELRGVRAPYCLLVIPLLVETGQRDLVDRVLVVDADEETRLRRVQRRDRRSADEIRAIQQTQAGRDARLSAADDLVLNNGGLDDLAQQVQRLHAKYLDLAAKAPGTAKRSPT